MGYRNSKRLVKWLENLTPRQKEILSMYIDNNTRTFRFSIDKGEIVEIEAAGILYKPTGLIDLGQYCEYNINPWVWDYLKQHPELLHT